MRENEGVLNWRKNSGRVKKKIPGFRMVLFSLGSWENLWQRCLCTEVSAFWVSEKLSSESPQNEKMGVLGSLVGTLWVAPWGISPGVTEPRWNEPRKWDSLLAPWRGSPLGSPFTGKKRTYLFPSCSSRLTWGMTGITGPHKGRESPCQPFPLHSQVETVNTHLPYCLFSLLLLFFHLFVWFF